MVSWNCQFIVKVCSCFLGLFCLMSPSFRISKTLSLLHKFYACFIMGSFLYLFQYYVRGKFVHLFPKMSLLFIILDLLDFSAPHAGVFAAIIYAVFLKRDTFLVFYSKFIDSDNFLGERYCSVKKSSFLLFLEFLSLNIFYILYFYVLVDYVDHSYGIHYPVPKNNFSYCFTTFLFLFTICSVRVFVVLIRIILVSTNKKLMHGVEGMLSFSCCKELPHFMSNFQIYPFLEQYKRCFELIRFFNEYFGLQVLIISCVCFIVLINNMYLSTLKLKNTVLESIPPYILFFRHITNASMYLVSTCFMWVSLLLIYKL